MAKVLKVEWTDTAKNALNEIYEFHSENSEVSSFKRISEIVERADSIVFLKQYQVDEFNPNYRKIVVRDYKVLYKVIDNCIVIMNVISCKANPDSQGNF